MHSKSICFVLAVIPLLAGCHEAPVFDEPVRPVRYVEAGTEEAGGSKRFPGVAESEQEMRLSLKASGTLIALPIRLGMRVKAGDLVAQLDPADYVLKVETAEAGLAAAKAQARNAESEYSRVQQLYVNNNASQSDLDAALAARDASKAQVVAEDRQVALAKSAMSYTELRAPIDGVVTSVPVEVSENVQAGQVAAVLASGTGVNVSVKVPENTISRLWEGAAVSLTFDAIRSEQPFHGTVTELGAVAERNSTYPVTVSVQDGGATILPGMAAQVTFEVRSDTEPGQVILPLSAVGEDHGGERFVYVLEPADTGFGTARKRPVTLGALAGDTVVITGGVDAGTRVVTAGVSRIQDGERVRVPE